MNALSPVLAGRFQVTATVVKLIPLGLMAVVGTVYGLIHVEAGAEVPTLIANFATGGSGHTDTLFAAVVATAFAYEGWILATSINAELHNAKKNLPIALTVGTAIIMVVYIAYYVGVAGGASVDTLRSEGATVAFSSIFGNFVSVLLNVFIAISCLGTLNGLMLSCTRSMYALSARGQGPSPKVFSRVDETTDMPTNSSVISLLFCVLWLFYFFGANLRAPLFGLFSFDSSELPIITIYAFYVPIFLCFLFKNGKKSVWKNGVMPAMATVAAVFMVFAAVYAHGIVPYQKAQAATTDTVQTVLSVDADGRLVADDETVSVVAPLTEESDVWTVTVPSSDCVELKGADGASLGSSETADFFGVVVREGKIAQVVVDGKEIASDAAQVTLHAYDHTPTFTFPVLFYLIVFTVIMVVGELVWQKNRRAEKKAANE
jgi:amino acid transporter